MNGTNVHYHDLSRLGKYMKVKSHCKKNKPFNFFQNRKKFYDLGLF